MKTNDLIERLRASPTCEIMLEAADAIAALQEDYKDLEAQLAAVGAGGVSLMGDRND